jgi:formylglycine-generating enzyme required for sulfatase activity
MGSSSDDPEAYANEKPRRELDLKEYRIGCYPITNAQYARFARDSGHAPPQHWTEEWIPVGLKDHPVVNVSFDDANAYCEWLSRTTAKPYRLPKEEEWEKAARGGLPDTRCYPWGDEWQPSHCNTQELGQNGTTFVCEFERIGQSPFGIVDLVGNVLEWTASWYMRYPGSLHDSLNFERRLVVRGGSWRHSRWDARISWRGRYEPNARRPYLGFRVVLDAPVDRAELRGNLAAHFSADELRTLGFDLGLEHENLPAMKDALARELMASCERHGLVFKLMKACQRQRPSVSW